MPSTAQLRREGSSIAWGQVVIVVDQQIDEVMSIVGDYASYVHFMPNFTKSKVLARRGSRARLYMEVSIAKGTLPSAQASHSRRSDGSRASGSALRKTAGIGLIGRQSGRSDELDCLRAHATNARR